MTSQRRTWQEELAIIDRTMKAISDVTDPEKLVQTYWDSIDELLPANDYLAISRRGVDPPWYLITRSSRFVEHFNPWTQRHRLPKLQGGLVGEIAYANQPVIIENLPARIQPDDPAMFYLEGFQSLVALPQYDGGEGLNVSMRLIPPGHEFDHKLIPTLHWQSGLFGRGTQNLVLKNQLGTALATLDHELQTVGQIQRSLLPQKTPDIPGFDVATHYVTSARAGGDYYDFFPLAGNRWGLFIADVSGHGTPAAVLMAITHALAHARPGTHTPPNELLKFLNEQLVRSYTRNGTFVTAFYAVLDPAACTLTYSAGGHNPPRLARGDGVIGLDEVGAFPLGITNAQSYDEATIKLQSGDMLLLYTDGITEAMAPPTNDESHNEYGVEHLDKVLLSSRSQTSSKCIEQIRADLAAFTANAPPTDDQTLVAIRCT